MEEVRSQPLAAMIGLRQCEYWWVARIYASQLQNTVLSWQASLTRVERASFLSPPLTVSGARTTSIDSPSTRIAMVFCLFECPLLGQNMGPNQ